MRKLTWLVSVSLALLVASCQKPAQAPAKKPLLCYVGGTMRPAMEELAAAYLKKTGQEVQLDFADSGQCLVKIQQTHKGDLYVAHDPFGAAARKQGLADESWVLATLTPVIVVPKENPKKIQRLDDLAQEGLKLGLTDAMYSTLGHMLPGILERSGLRGPIEKNVVTRSRSGGEVANAVGLGNLDAAVVWNAVAHLRQDRLVAVPIAQRLLPRADVDTITSATYGPIDLAAIRVECCRLTCSEQPDASADFGRFLVSPQGRECFNKYGFSPAPNGK